MTSLLSTISTRLQALLTRSSPLQTAALTLPILFLYYYAYNDYIAWLSIGRGGLPRNILGYVIQNLVRPLALFGRDPSVKSGETAGPLGRRYLRDDEVPMRGGGRPRIGKWILPQRQLDMKAAEGWVERYNNLLTTLSRTSPSLLLIQTSLLERSGPALFLAPDVSKHPGACGSRNEIFHLHESDGSMHLMLAPRDARLVIERGWGERFGLSGTVMPSWYVMVYAPRSEAEMSVVEGILRAAARFMIGDEGR